MKKYILFSIFSLVIGGSVYSQCSTTPVEEAVRNGDFENGYLGAGGATDFYSDMNFGGAQFSGTGAGTCNCCQYGMGDQYMVAKAENFTCAGTNFTNNTYWGISYGGDANFKDHTPGLNGAGHALLVDLNGRTTSPKTGGKPIAWEQTVDIYPSQNYWFSAYVANFSNGTAPIMQMTVLPMNGGVVDNANIVTLPVTGSPTGLMNWSQMTAQWTPPAVYDQVTLRFEFVNVAGGASGLDVAIDDISFINSCQNFASQNKPEIPQDTINLCATGGTANLTATYPSSGNETYTWFEGGGATQNVIPGVTGLSHTVSQIGTYRICVQDPDNSCATNDVVVVVKEMELELPDVVLCSPPTATIDVDAALQPTGAYAKNYTWTVPAGATNPGGANSATFTTSGNYSVTVTNPAVIGCSVTENFNIDATELPNVPTDLRYCKGGGEDVVLSIGDGKNYAWSTSSSMTPLIGTGTSVTWTVPNGTNGDQTIYVQNAETTPLGTGGPTSLTSYPSGIKTLTFTTSQTVKLTSLQMNLVAWANGCNAAGTNTNGTVSISGTAAFSSNVTFNCGSATTINPNWTLPPGTYTITSNKPGSFAANPGTTSIGGGVVNITSTGQTMFGSLTFESSQACDPMPVILKDSVCCTQLPPTVSGADTVCVGGSVTLTATPDVLTTGAITYQWYSDAGLIPSATASTYNVPAAAALASTEFWATVTSSGSCSGPSPISNKIRVMVNPNPTTPSITIDPNQTTFCEGEAHDLTAASTISSGTLGYQWYIGGVAAGTSATQAGTTSPDGSYTYKVVVGALGCKDSLEQSITISPLDSAELTVDNVATCANVGDIDLTQYLTAGTTAGGTFSGTNVTGTNFSTAIAGGSYKVVYTTGGTCSEKDSLTIDVTDKAEAQIVTTDTTVCFGSPAFTVRLTATSATDGVWSGTGISAGTFTPGANAAGDYLIKYVKAGLSASCSDSDSVTVTIAPLDVAKVDQMPSLCSTDSPIQLNLDGTSTTGGIWKDSLAANTYVNATGMFDPTGLTDGLYKVYYVTTGSCPGIDSGYVTVTSDITYVMNHTKTDYCRDFGLDTLEVDKAGGEIWTFSTKGVVNASARAFDTRLMDVGVDTIYYGKAGSCGDTIKIAITINAMDSAKIDSLPAVCEDLPAFDFTLTAGSTTGGVWSGTGITDAANGTFDPATAGPGEHLIKYTSPNNCVERDSVHILVKPRLDATVSPSSLAFCGNDIAVKEASAAQGGGNWFGWGGSFTQITDTLISFDPSVVTAGMDTIWYRITEQCGDTGFVEVTVSANDVVAVDSVAEVCNDAPAFDFTISAASVTGGTWSGTGITDATNGTFDPATAGAGEHLIKYTSPGGCPSSDSVHILVKPRLDATLDRAGPEALCQNASAITIQAAQGGGTWTGWGGTFNLDNDSTITFDPSQVAAGIDSIYYTIGGTCGAVDSIVIAVQQKDSAKIVAISTVCLADGIQDLEVTAGTTTGGVWTGTGITNSSTGLFNPALANLEPTPNDITYTTSGACFDFDRIQIFVVNQVDVNISKPANDTIKVCQGGGNANLSLLTGSTQGGTWSVNNGGTLANPATNGSSVEFVTSLATGGTTYEVLHLAGDQATSCSDRDNVYIYVIPVLDPTVSGAPNGNVCSDAGTYTGFSGAQGGGTWTISNGGVIDAATGVIDMAASGAGTYTVTYTHGPGTQCEVSDNGTITIVDPLNADFATREFCITSSPGNIVPTQSGGTWSAVQGGIITAAGLFNPAVSGPGTFPVTYTRNDNVCNNSTTQDITVVDAPTVTIDADTVLGCEPLTVTFTENSSSTATQTIWKFTDGTEVNDAANLNSVTKVFNAGSYSVTAEQAFDNGCELTTQSGLISVSSPPVADFNFSPEKTSVLDPTFQFTNTSTTSGLNPTYDWTYYLDTIAVGRSTDENPFAEFQTEEGDTFNICLTVTDGCPADTCKKVVILNNVSVYVPNSFTPNGDGLNDVFYPNGKYHDNPDGISDYEFLVYNRWGEVIFQSTNPYEGWDGRINNRGPIVQQEVYVWRITVFDPNSSRKIIETGTVTLVR